MKPLILLGLLMIACVIASAWVPWLVWVAGALAVVIFILAAMMVGIALR